MSAFGGKADIAIALRIKADIAEAATWIKLHAYQKRQDQSTADIRAHQLNGDHERGGKEDRPKEVESELRPCLRISRYSRGIIIRCARDQAGAQSTHGLAESERGFLCSQHE